MAGKTSRKTKSPLLAAGNEDEENGASSSTAFRFIVGSTPTELQSGAHMTMVRKRAMSSYLNEGKTKKRKSLTPAHRLLSSFDPEFSVCFTQGPLGMLEIEEYGLKNEIELFKDQHENRTIKFEKPERSKLLDSFEDKNKLAFYEQISKSDSHSEESVWSRELPNLTSIHRPCNTLYIENLPSSASEDELKSLFLGQVGYKRMCFRTEQHGRMCCVEFEDIQSAIKALLQCQGYRLANVTGEGIKISYCRVPLTVNESWATLLQTPPRERQMLVNCTCGEPKIGQSIFPCEKCGKWQHVECYRDLIKSREDMQECLNCCIKQEEERMKYVIHQSSQEGTAQSVADTPNELRAKSATEISEALWDFQRPKDLQARGKSKAALKPSSSTFGSQGSIPLKSQMPKVPSNSVSQSMQTDLMIGPQSLGGTELFTLLDHDASYNASSNYEIPSYQSLCYQIPSSIVPPRPMIQPTNIKEGDSMQGIIPARSFLESQGAEQKHEFISPRLKLKDGVEEGNSTNTYLCGCGGQDNIQSQILLDLWSTLKEDWNLVQGQLPEEWKWDTEYHNECWTCTPLDTDEPNVYPLTIARAPVVLPVQYQWPPIGGVNPPPDPRPSIPINCRAELPLDTVRDLFLTFRGSLGFYILINGLLQVIVPEDFDTTWASSHLPHKYGGLKVCYIPQTIEPTMRPSTTQISNTDPSISSYSPSTVNLNWPGRAIHNSFSDSLKINDFLEARPRTRSRKEKFSGRIGLKVIKDGNPYLAMSTHVITEAILAKSHLESIFGSTRMHFERLNNNWNEYVEMWAGNEKIGTIEKSFDARPGNYPNGFDHDVTLIKATTPASVRHITSPIPNIGWLNHDSWSSLRQQTSTVKILAPTENHRAAKCLKCSRLAEVLIVGEGIFLNQSAALNGGKSLKDHDASIWKDLVSRAVLYRVFPDFDPPNGYSGIALYADGTREDTTEGPGVVGFQSFVQRSGHVQNFEMEGAPLEQRLKLGRVAFYGAFEVPRELKEYTIV